MREIYFTWVYFIAWSTQQKFIFPGPSNSYFLNKKSRIIFSLLQRHESFIFRNTWNSFFFLELREISLPGFLDFFVISGILFLNFLNLSFITTVYQKTKSDKGSQVFYFVLEDFMVTVALSFSNAWLIWKILLWYLWKLVNVCKP